MIVLKMFMTKTFFGGLKRFFGGFFIEFFVA